MPQVLDRPDLDLTTSETPNGQRVATEEIELHPDVYWAIRTYRKLAEDGRVGANHTRVHDYRRWSHVYEMLPEKVSILDIGIGAGQFVNACARSQRFGRIVGMDYTQTTGLQHLSKHWEFVKRSLTAAVSPGMRSEYVTCMECIEHISDPDFEVAVENLKFLATRKLIVTVPFEEPEPLPHFHKQRFDMDRLLRLFPSSRVTLLTYRGKAMWAVVEWTPI